MEAALIRLRLSGRKVNSGLILLCALRANTLGKVMSPYSLIYGLGLTWFSYHEVLPSLVEGKLKNSLKRGRFRWPSSLDTSLLLLCQCVPMIVLFFFLSLQYAHRSL